MKISFIDEDGDEIYYGGDKKCPDEEVISLLTADSLEINGKLKKVIKKVPIISTYENNSIIIKRVEITLRAE